MARLCNKTFFNENSTGVSINLSTAIGDDFESTNATVESIDIKVSGNMITATFANVPVEHDVTTEMVSGTIVAKEQ